MEHSSHGCPHSILLYLLFHSVHPPITFLQHCKQLIIFSTCFMFLYLKIFSLVLTIVHKTNKQKNVCQLKKNWHFFNFLFCLCLLEGKLYVTVESPTPWRRRGPEEDLEAMTRLHEQVVCTPSACTYPSLIAWSFSNLISGFVESSHDWVMKKMIIPIL